MKKNLPVYEMLINDDEAIGMYTISLVDKPATEVEWVAFAAQEPEIQKFTVMDSLEHKVLTVIMRCDHNIYRRSPSGEEYYVRFSAPTLKIMAQKLLKNGYQNLVNVMHGGEDSYITGVEMEQIFCKDIAKGINPEGFEEVEDGSLFAIYKIEDDAVWKAVQDGIVKSVSLEGVFDVQPYKEEEENIMTINDLWDAVRKIDRK